MATRGFWGFKKDGTIKACYNHYDSYPSGLGVQVKYMIDEYSNEELLDKFDKIHVICDEEPVPEDVREKAFELGVVTCDDAFKKQSYYSFFHSLMFNPAEMIRHDDLIYMFDYSRYCEEDYEYSYVINLDTMVLMAASLRGVVREYKLNLSDVRMFTEEEYAGVLTNSL